MNARAPAGVMADAATARSLRADVLRMLAAHNALAAELRGFYEVLTYYRITAAALDPSAIDATMEAQHAALHALLAQTGDFLRLTELQEAARAGPLRAAV